MGLEDNSCPFWGLLHFSRGMKLWQLLPEKRRTEKKSPPQNSLGFLFRVWSRLPWRKADSTLWGHPCPLLPCRVLPVHIHEIQTKTREYLKALKINNTLSWTLNLRNLAPKFTRVTWDSREGSSDSKPTSFQPFTSSWWYNTNHRCSTWTHSLGIDRRHGCLIDLRSPGLASWNFGRYPNSVKWPFIWGGFSKQKTIH